MTIGYMTQMTPTERRNKARKIRALTEVGDRPKTMTEASTIQEVSRTWAYHIMEELSVWEAKATRKQIETDDAVAAQIRRLGPSCTTQDIINVFSEL